MYNSQQVPKKTQNVEFLTVFEQHCNPTTIKWMSIYHSGSQTGVEMKTSTTFRTKPLNLCCNIDVSASVSDAETIL